LAAILLLAVGFMSVVVYHNYQRLKTAKHDALRQELDICIAQNEAAAESAHTRNAIGAANAYVVFHQDKYAQANDFYEQVKSLAARIGASQQDPSLAQVCRDRDDALAEYQAQIEHIEGLRRWEAKLEQRIIDLARQRKVCDQKLKRLDQIPWTALVVPGGVREYE
jgi:hypothetical protein